VLACLEQIILLANNSSLDDSADLQEANLGLKMEITRDCDQKTNTKSAE
jgi:hypothetical protein